MAYARQVLAELDALAPGECFTEPDVQAIFEGYLTAWEDCAVDAAARGDKFLWEADLPAEQVEYHMHAFQKVADVLDARRARTGVRRGPEEGEDFYVAVLNGALTALEAEGASHAAYAQHLGEFWPGRDRLA